MPWGECLGENCLGKVGELVHEAEALIKSMERRGGVFERAGA